MQNAITVQYEVKNGILEFRNCKNHGKSKCENWKSNRLLLLCCYCLTLTSDFLGYCTASKSLTICLSNHLWELLRWLLRHRTFATDIFQQLSSVFPLSLLQIVHLCLYTCSVNFCSDHFYSWIPTTSDVLSKNLNMKRKEILVVRPIRGTDSPDGNLYADTKVIQVLSEFPDNAPPTVC